jgi:hypothetical protein
MSITLHLRLASSCESDTCNEAKGAVNSRLRSTNAYAETLLKISENMDDNLPFRYVDIEFIITE